uniref:Reverse transcriptase Ty1/copia-type domain-containing protein n=1 Tax=Tanacetum cinerariifolium TaxID=118510 RepID=A0A6L2ME86_TANCI|nr:hypothetical protein [Tanacetum cinerariifolium]
MVNGTNHSRVNHNATTVLKGHLHKQVEDQGYFNPGCSRHMTRNISYLNDFKEFDGGYVAFEEELKVVRLQAKMCDKKNIVLFTDTECFVLSRDFMLADESHVLLKVPRKNNMYSVDMKNIVPKKDLTCLVKDNLVRGLPSKHFENDQTYVACLKGKQHKVSFKSKIQNYITQPLFMLHMDLFSPTSNRVLVVKPHFKTFYELFRGRKPALNEGFWWKTTNEQGFITAIYEEKTHVDLYTCLFAYFSSQEEPKRITNALKDPAWVEAMQKELLQFHLQKMDVKSAFLYERIKEEVYVCQPSWFEDPDYHDKVYKVEKALYGSHQAPRAWRTHLLLRVASKAEVRWNIISQDKYVDGILRKFKYEDVKPTNTLMDKEKALLKDSNGDDVDVHLYSQFWRTASVRTLDNREIELNATVKTITKASVRKHLKLADADGISSLPTTEIFEQLALMGNMKRESKGFSGVETALLPTMLVTEQVSPGEEKQLKHKIRRAVIDSSNDAKPSLDAEDSPKQERMIEEFDKYENVNLTNDDETFVETLLNIKRSAAKDKGKGIMQEPELPKKIKKRKKERIQLSLDEELDQKLYAEELAKEIARQEQEKYNLEKALELQKQLDEKKEDRGRVQVELFQGIEEVMKRSRFDLQLESSKKQKLDEQAKVQVDSDQEEDEIKKYMKIVPGE